MRKPFIHAILAAGYIALLVVIAQSTASLLKNKPDNILMPMTALATFVLSAAIMGFLFLSEPLKLLIENKKREAAVWFGKAVGFFACFVVLFAILVFIVK